MLALAPIRPATPYWPMAANPTPERLSDRDALGKAIKKFRQRAQLTQEAAAQRLGVAVPTWQRYEWGARGLTYEKLANIALVVGVDRQTLLDEAGVIGDEFPLSEITERSPAPVRDRIIRSSSTLPVRDRVQAGAWLLADDLGQSEARQEPAQRDPRYAHADQWLSDVIGDSVDLLRIFDGDMILCVDIIGAGYHPKTGDIVEVERLRFGGQERELTVKQVEVRDDGSILLWPRSSNLRWREPLRMVPDQAESEIEVRIRGLVLTTIRKLA